MIAEETFPPNWDMSSGWSVGSSSEMREGLASGAVTDAASVRPAIVNDQNDTFTIPSVRLLWPLRERRSLIGPRPTTFPFY